MLKVLRWLAIAIGVIVLLIAGVFVVARFHDGPLGLAPGGALRSGEIVEQPVTDWKFADVETIELQLDGESTSRTTWILLHDGRAFIPASLSFPPGKRWHKTADQNGAAWVRVAGRRYPVTLKRELDEPTRAALIEVVRGKYGGGGPPSEGGVWFFEMTSRAP
jgi:hypothetical protein